MSLIQWFLYWVNRPWRRVDNLGESPNPVLGIDDDKPPPPSDKK
jgi:hypothetical protein